MTKQGSLVPLKMLLFAFHGANTMVISFLPLLLTYRGLTGQQIGWVLAVGSTVSILAKPLWGYLSDKYQTVRNILILCAIGLIISSSIFFRMTTLPLILGFAFVFYFFTTPIGSLADSLAHRRAEALGVSFGSIRTWGSIGFALCSLLVGQLMDFIGIQYLILPYVFMGSLLLICSFRLVDVHVETKPVQLRDVKKIIQNRQLFLFLILLLFVMITHRLNDSYIGLFIGQLGGPDSMVGWAWFIGVSSEAIVFATAGFWFKKYHPLVYMIAASLAFALRWFLYAWVDLPILIVVFQFMHGVSFGVFYSAAFQYVGRLIPKELQSTGHLVFATVFFGISGIIASLGGGVLMDTIGGNWMYFIMGCMAVIGAILITLYHAVTMKNETRRLAVS